MKMVASIKSISDLTNLGIARRLLNAERFNKFDKILEKYSEHNLRDYIETCCYSGSLIEAYSLVIQYSQYTVLLACGFNYDKESNENKAIQVLHTLHNLKLANDNFFSLYKKLNKTRNSLTHKLINNTTFLNKIAKSKAEVHYSQLIKLLNLSDGFYIDIARFKPEKFLFSHNANKLRSLQENDKRFDNLYKIINDLTARENDLKDSDSVEKYVDKVHKEAIKKIKSLFPYFPYFDDHS